MVISEQKMGYRSQRIEVVKIFDNIGNIIEHDFNTKTRTSRAESCFDKRIRCHPLSQPIPM